MLISVELQHPLEKCNFSHLIIHILNLEISTLINLMRTFRNSEEPFKNSEENCIEYKKKNNRNFLQQEHDFILPTKWHYLAKEGSVEYLVHYLVMILH